VKKVIEDSRKHKLLGKCPMCGGHTAASVGTNFGNKPWISTICIVTCTQCNYSYVEGDKGDES